MLRVLAPVLNGLPKPGGSVSQDRRGVAVGVEQINQRKRFNIQ